jgi:hypothetical protein
MKANKKDIERACQMVYEHFTGVHECIYEYRGMRGAFSQWECVACGNKTSASHNLAEKPFNPPLATPLDAWAEHIWPVMGVFPARSYNRHLEDITGEEEIFSWEARPLHHLEAALKAANLYDEWKKGCE